MNEEPWRASFNQVLLNRDVAQPGSALRSGRRGRWFESSHPDNQKSLLAKHWQAFCHFSSVGRAAHS